jgi:hypothetical protein
MLKHDTKSLKTGIGFGLTSGTITTVGCAAIMVSILWAFIIIHPQFLSGKNAGIKAVEGYCGTHRHRGSGHCYHHLVGDWIGATFK